MFINGTALLKAAPILQMVSSKRSSGISSFGLSEAGYDIRIKQSIMFDVENNQVLVDNEVTNDVSMFALASAIEEFNMPDNLVGMVADKSTWARHGLSLFNTVIEPGWKGFLTLELSYVGKHNLYIPAGSGIAQVLFSQLSEPASYSGKYQNQEDRPTQPRNSDDFVEGQSVQT